MTPLCTIKFTVPGPPKPKGRPRFTVTKGPKPFARAYTPKGTAQYENLVTMCFMEERTSRHRAGEYPHDVLAEKWPVMLGMVIVIPMPKSKPKWWRQCAKFCTTRPDIDNIEKAIADGLNGVAFQDDAQVVEVACRKVYGAEPRVDVTVAYYDIPRKT